MSSIYQIKEPRGAVLTRDVGLGGVLIGQECRYGICGGKGWGSHTLINYLCSMSSDDNLLVILLLWCRPSLIPIAKTLSI